MNANRQFHDYYYKCRFEVTSNKSNTVSIKVKIFFFFFRIPSNTSITLLVREMCQTYTVGGGGNMNQVHGLSGWALKRHVSTNASPYQPPLKEKKNTSIISTAMDQVASLRTWQNKPPSLYPLIPSPSTWNGRVWGEVKEE